MEEPDRLLLAADSPVHLNALFKSFVESDPGRQAGQDTEYVEPPFELVEWVMTCRITGVGNIGQFQIDGQLDERPKPTVIPFTVPAMRLFKALKLHCNTRMDELDSMGVSEMYTRVRKSR